MIFQSLNDDVSLVLGIKRYEHFLSARPVRSPGKSLLKSGLTTVHSILKGPVLMTSIGGIRELGMCVR